MWGETVTFSICLCLSPCHSFNVFFFSLSLYLCLSRLSPSLPLLWLQTCISLSGMLTESLTHSLWTVFLLASVFFSERYSVFVISLWVLNKSPLSLSLLCSLICLFPCLSICPCSLALSLSLALCVSLVSVCVVSSAWCGLRVYLFHGNLSSKLAFDPLAQSTHMQTTLKWDTKIHSHPPEFPS